MLIIGIDPSLTATGIVALQDGKPEVATTTKNRPELPTIERVRVIKQQISKIIEIPSFAVDLIVIEGFSFGSRGQSLFETAYLGYRVREDLEGYREREGIPWIEVPPKSLKKFVTDNGNAGKELMLQQVYKRWSYETHDNNIADAYALARVGMAYLGEDSDLYAYQKSVIADLKNPKPKKSRKKVKE